MAKQKTLRQLVEENVKDTRSMRQVVESMERHFDSVDTRFEALFDIVDRNEKKLDGVFLDVRDIKERMTTKIELQGVKGELMSHIDAVYHRMDRFDQELTSGQSRTERIEGRVGTIERHVGLA